MNFLPKENKERFLTILSEASKKARRDNLLMLLQKHGAIISGGIFASIYTNTDINDIDVFFRSAEDANAFMKEAGIGHSNTLKNIKFGIFQIIRFNTAETPEKLFESFDILAAQIAYDCRSGTFHSAAGAVDDLLEKTVRVVRRTNSLVVSLNRVAKWRDSKKMTIHPDTWKVFEQTCNIPDSEFNFFPGYSNNKPEEVVGHRQAIWQQVPMNWAVFQQR